LEQLHFDGQGVILFGKLVIKGIWRWIKPQWQQVIATGNGGREIGRGGNAFIPYDSSVVKFLKPFEQFIQASDANDPSPGEPAARLSHLLPPKVVRFFDVANKKAWLVTIHQSFQGGDQVSFIPKPAALVFIVEIELEKIREIKEDDWFNGSFRASLVTRCCLSHQPYRGKKIQPQCG
jgi:hypothetical protein